MGQVSASLARELTSGGALAEILARRTNGLQAGCGGVSSPPVHFARLCRRACHGWCCRKVPERVFREEGVFCSEMLQRLPGRKGATI